MSTHNIGCMKKYAKLSLNYQISSNTHLISSSGLTVKDMETGGILQSEQQTMWAMIRLCKCPGLSASDCPLCCSHKLTATCCMI